MRGQALLLGVVLGIGCGAPAEVAQPRGAGEVASVVQPVAEISKLDVLFVIDNTNSMQGEQASLRAALPRFIESLTSGQSAGPRNLYFPPMHDIHIGVVSSDMGTPGVESAGCHTNGGDDGRLQHTPRLTDCAADYPSYLSYEEGVSQEQLAQDFACIASLGTGGCGFEMPLESAFKALWPSQYIDPTGRAVEPNPFQFLSTTPQGELGRGDVAAELGGNAGFLRNDADDASMLAIVVVTDEDDCSMKSSVPLTPNVLLPSGSPLLRQDMNLRCFLNPEQLYDVYLRYAQGLRMLRPNDPRRVVFAAIAGVPNDLVDDSARQDVDFADGSAREVFYGSILSDARMQEVVDPSSAPGLGTGSLTPSCRRTDASGKPSTAYPPRRIVQLAQAFGEQGTVQSICQDDFAPAVDGVVDLIASQLAAH